VVVVETGMGSGFGSGGLAVEAVGWVVGSVDQAVGLGGLVAGVVGSVAPTEGPPSLDLHLFHGLYHDPFHDHEEPSSHFQLYRIALSDGWTFGATSV